MRVLLISGRALVLLIDDLYRAIGLENADKYTKMLYEFIGWRLYGEHGTSKTLILPTMSRVRQVGNFSEIDIHMSERT